MPSSLPSWAGIGPGGRWDSFDQGEKDGNAPPPAKGSSDQAVPSLQGVNHTAAGAEPMFGEAAGSASAAADLAPLAML